MLTSLTCTDSAYPAHHQLETRQMPPRCSYCAKTRLFLTSTWHSTSISASLTSRKGQNLPESRVCAKTRLLPLILAGEVSGLLRFSTPNGAGNRLTADLAGGNPCAPG